MRHLANSPRCASVDYENVGNPVHGISFGGSRTSFSSKVDSPYCLCVHWLGEYRYEEPYTVPGK